MYGETADELHATLGGILDNIEYFNLLHVQQEEFAVIVLIDGCEQIHDSMFDEFFDYEDQ